MSILGERYTHGHVFDFYKQLRNNPKKLRVLGNGRQRKSYLYVQDCIDAIILTMARSADKISIYNLGVDSYCEINDFIGWICEALGVSPSIAYSGGDRGWIGDNPFIFLDTTKIRALGWSPKLTIKEGVIKTVEFLKANEWVYKFARMTAKYAVITGASRGLGEHLACRFWDSGYSLGLVSRNAASMDQTRSRLDLEAGRKCDVFACDLGDPASVQNLVSEISARAAQINVIVNNAAIQGPIGPLEQNDFGDWEQTIRVNLLSPVAICRGLLPRMAKAPEASILNLSGGGATGPRANFTAYASAKAALVRFSETLAEEVREQGVTVNCIAPGAMKTAMLG